MVEGGQCVAWVGSGMSVGTHYPSWSGAVKKLCQSFHITPLSKRASSSDLIAKAEECKQKALQEDGHPQRFYRHLNNLFGQQPNLNRFSYQYLLRIPFRAYVTTNFDPLLHMTAALHNMQYNAYPLLPIKDLTAQPPFVFYVHGAAGKGWTNPLVLAESDFIEAYNQGATEGFLYAVLHDYPVLFLGCQLQEPALRPVFDRIQRIHAKIKAADPKRPLPPRIILLSIKYDTECGTESYRSREEQDKRRLESMGIETITYRPRNRLHEQVNETVRLLFNLSKPQPPPTKDEHEDQL